MASGGDVPALTEHLSAGLLHAFIDKGHVFDQLHPAILRGLEQTRSPRFTE
jgi:hypothetical protein